MQFGFGQGRAPGGALTWMPAGEIQSMTLSSDMPSCQWLLGFGV